MEIKTVQSVLEIVRNSRDDEMFDYIIRDNNYPFLLYLNNIDILILATYDILMLDFDENNGISKLDVADILRNFLKSENNLASKSRVTKTELCFKLFETDRGVHAFVISHRIPKCSEPAIQIALKTNSDYNYTIISCLRGYCVRMSPKIYNDDLTTYREDKQFISRPMEKDLYVGNKDNIDPALEAFVDMIVEIQREVLSNENKFAIAELCKKKYRKISKKYKLRENAAKRWIKN